MSKEERRILNIDTNLGMMEKFPFHDRLTFWQHFIQAADGLNLNTCQAQILF